MEESSVVVRGGFVDEMDEEGEADDDMVVSDLGIPALHPDIPVCPSVGAGQQTWTKGGRIKGIRLAQLHTLPISQVRYTQGLHTDLDWCFCCFSCVKGIVRG